MWWFSHKNQISDYGKNTINDVYNLEAREQISFAVDECGQWLRGRRPTGPVRPGRQNFHSMILSGFMLEIKNKGINGGCNLLPRLEIAWNTRYILYIIRILYRTLLVYSVMKFSFFKSLPVVENTEYGYLAGKSPLDSLEGLESIVVNFVKHFLKIREIRHNFLVWKKFVLYIFFKTCFENVGLWWNQNSFKQMIHFLSPNWLVYTVMWQRANVFIHILQ